MNNLIVKIDNKKSEVTITDKNEITIDGTSYHFEISKVNENCGLLRIDNKVYNVTYFEKSSGNYNLLIDGYNFECSVLSNLEDAALTVLKNKEILSRHGNIKAPMPGLIVKIFKKVGDPISIGEPAALLEAMKMENELRSPATGTVSKVYFKVGDSVEKDSVLFEVD